MTRVLVEAVPAIGATVALGAEERHYLARVRRLAVGDPVELIDRSGARAAGRVCAAGRGAIAVEVIAALGAAGAALPLKLLVAVPKRDLMDDVVRGLSEIGAARLTPIRTERSVVAPGAAKLARWRRIAEEAVRQCGRGAPLAVDGFTPLAEALAATGAGARLILDPRAPRRRIAELCAGAASIAIAIGPEGGFTAAEIALAEASGFASIRLGATVLRVETAALAAAVLAADALG